MWTVYGKVKKIVKYSPLDTTASDSIVFEYDPLGNRLEKRNYIHQLPLCHVCLATPISDTVKYIRDASGNILAVYDRKRDTVRLTELDLYGSKRIGVIDTVMRMKKPSVGYGPFDSLRIAYLEGQRQYELTTHLGNVLATVSDRKIPIDTNSLGYAQYYLANVINAQDYYPFGMIEPGRQYAILGDSAYKYAFNGKLHDDNIYGKDNFYDYGMRDLDVRLGRPPSPDPLEQKYPELSPYQFFSDNPVWFVDLDGEEGKPYFDKHTHVDQHDHPFVYVWDLYSDAVNNFFLTPIIDAVKTIKDPNASGGDKAEAAVNAILFYGTLGGGEEGAPEEGFGREGPVINKTNSGDVAEGSNNSAQAAKAGEQNSNAASDQQSAANNTQTSVQKIKREPSSVSRQKWEKATGKKWPKEPGNPNKNQVVSHKTALADGGTNDVNNYGPSPAKEHIDMHKANGDFRRWGTRAKKPKTKE